MELLLLRLAVSHLFVKVMTWNGISRKERLFLPQRGKGQPSCIQAEVDGHCRPILS
jgi:hypothetical protein